MRNERKIYQTRNTAFALSIFFIAGITFISDAVASKPELKPEDYIIPVTQEMYPKAYQKWGVDGFKRINAMLEPAMRRAYASPECDKIEIVDFAIDRSAKDNKLTVVVICSNRQRFYFTEADLQSADPAVSKQAKTKSLDKTAAISTCDTAVKNKLAHPSTFDPAMLSYDLRDTPEGNFVITFDFTARNGFGAELGYKAQCVFDDRGMQPPDIWEK